MTRSIAEPPSPVWPWPAPRAGGVAAIPRVMNARPTADADPLSVTVLLDEPIGTIKPAIYSQFAEHIGGVIYDGIWVGEDSKVPISTGSAKLIEHVKTARPCRGALAGRLLRGQVSLARRHRAPNTRPRRFGRWRERPSRTSSALMSSCGSAGCAKSSPISRPTSEPARRKSSSNGSSIATRRRARPRWPTNAQPTATEIHSESATGAWATKAGAAAVTSSPRITAASTESSPNGSPNTASRST